jgi:hypothetical protein
MYRFNPPKNLAQSQTLLNSWYGNGSDFQDDEHGTYKQEKGAVRFTRCPAHTLLLELRKHLESASV